jgi:hypothetical protein
MTQLEETERPIFRPAALARYRAARNEAELPRFLRPRSFLLFWLLLLLFAALGALAFATRVPVRGAGTAVVLAREGRPELADVPGDLALVLFVPCEAGALRAGARTFVHFGAGSAPAPTTLATADAALSPPEALRARFALSGAAALAPSTPAVAAIAALPPLPDGLSPAALAGAVLPVEVELGERRVLGLLPGMGRLFPAER